MERNRGGLVIGFACAVFLNSADVTLVRGIRVVSGRYAHVNFRQLKWVLTNQCGSET